MRLTSVAAYIKLVVLHHLRSDEDVKRLDGVKVLDAKGKDIAQTVKKVAKRPELMRVFPPAEDEPSHEQQKQLHAVVHS